MEKLLTVIVPTYNMEMYLDKCLTSLIVGEPDCELMRKLEVLVINDGSTDRSSEIAHGYESRYPYTFKVVDKSNGNYGSCINVALPIATGKYVKILDADDWFDTDVFREYLTWLQDKDVDAVFTDYCRVENDKSTLVHQLDVAAYCTRQFEEILSKKCLQKMYEVTYNIEIFENLDYHQTEGISYTDMEWMFLPMSVVKKFIYYPKPLYCYLFGRPGQTMNPVVYKANISMRIELVLSCIRMFYLCQAEGGKRKGISVNMDFLHFACLVRCIDLYEYFLNKFERHSCIKYLNHIDQEILRESPLFYDELNFAKYPSWKVDYKHLCFRIIRTWRKYGYMVAYIQLRIVNLYLGIISHRKIFRLGKVWMG